MQPECSTVYDMNFSVIIEGKNNDDSVYYCIIL